MRACKWKKWCLNCLKMNRMSNFKWSSMKRWQCLIHNGILENLNLIIIFKNNIVAEFWLIRICFLCSRNAHCPKHFCIETKIIYNHFLWFKNWYIIANSYMIRKKLWIVTLWIGHYHLSCYRVTWNYAHSFSIFVHDS